MNKIKKEIIKQDKKLKKNLLNALTILGVSVCVILTNGTICVIEKEEDLVEIVEKYNLEELQFYSQGKEVDIESLKKQQRFYSEFGKIKEVKNQQKFKNKSIKYNQKPTTKQKRYHRKG